MRIALASQEYPPETAHGGIATQTFAKASGLAARGHEVYVVTHSIDGQRHHKRNAGVDVIRIPGYDAHMAVNTEIVRWLSYSVLVAAEIAALNSKVKLDIIDFPEWGCEGYVHLLNGAAWDRVPTVIHLQGPLVMLAHTIGWPARDSELYRVGLRMEETCLRLADAIVSSSRCSADWVARHYDVDATAIPVLHTGVDAEVFRPSLAERERNPTVVFVGRVAFSKGVDTLVDAACVVADEMPNLRVRLIGKVEEAVRADLERRAHRAKLGSLLEFRGALPRADLAAELCRAHVFAAPSRYEGGPGFVYLEAMACAVPVIACSGSGAAEVIADGETGLLVPPGDVAGLAAALRELLSDASKREAMGRAAREYVVTHADARTCIERYESFLLSVAGASP